MRYGAHLLVSLDAGPLASALSPRQRVLAREAANHRGQEIGRLNAFELQRMAGSLRDRMQEGQLTTAVTLPKA